MSEESDFQKRLINQLSSVIDGMKTLNERISGNLETLGRFEVEFTKQERQGNLLRRDILDLKSDMGQFRSETNLRLQALLQRMDEIETVVDGNSPHIRALRIEASGQYNDILTAIQEGLLNNLSLRELSDRVVALERHAPG